MLSEAVLHAMPYLDLPYWGQALTLHLKGGGEQYDCWMFGMSTFREATSLTVRMCDFCHLLVWSQVLTGTGSDLRALVPFVSCAHCHMFAKYTPSFFDPVP